MGLFSHEYKVHTQTETGMVATPNQVGNTLNGAVIQSVKLKSDLAYILKDKAYNSITNIFNKAAKYSQEGGKYADILGTPKGTFIAKPITKELMNSALGFEPDKILLTKLQKADEYLYACYIYDTLVSDYAFEGDLEANTGQVKIEDKYYTYEGVHSSYYEFSHELKGYYWEYSESQIRYGYQGPTEVKVRHRVPIELDLQPNVDYLIVKYEYDEGIHYFLWNTTETGPLSKWYSNNQVPYYPSFYIRNNNDSIKRSDPDYYKLVSGIFNRAHLDFEDIVDSYNAETEVNKESEEDKDYKNSLNNIEEIVLTFAVDPTANDQRVMQYLFEFFTVMNNGLNSNSVTYECKGFGYTLRWDSINYEVKTGKIAPFHRYITETTQVSIPYQINNVTAYRSVQCLRIAHQLDCDTYEELLVTGLTEDHNNNGNTDTYTLPEFHNLKRQRDYSEEERQEMEEESSKVLVPLIPWIVQSKFGSIRGGDLLALGMAYVMHVYKKTKKKWYATKWFTIVRIALSIAVIIGSGGSLTWETLELNAIIEVLILILILIAVKVAVKYVLKLFHVDPQIIGIFEAVFDFICTVAVPGYGVANGIVNMSTEVITTGSLSLNTVADSLCAIAGSQIMELGGMFTVAGAAFKLGTDAGFYDALHNKNFAMAIVKAALVVAEAAVAYVKAENISNKNGKSDSNKDSKSDNADSKSSPKEEPSFAEKLGFRSLEGIGNVAVAVFNTKAQEQQKKLSKLNSLSISLAGQIQASEHYWADVLSPNNIVMQQLIIEDMYKPDYIQTVSIKHINDYAGKYGITI